MACVWLKVDGFDAENKKFLKGGRRGKNKKPPAEKDRGV
jgi:hypothetical protein